MTKIFNYGIVVAAILFSLICINHVYMQKKIESFCDLMESRGSTRDECYFIVDYIQHNTSLLTRWEFSGVLRMGQDMRAHPGLLIPFFTASLAYKESLEK